MLDWALLGTPIQAIVSFFQFIGPTNQITTSVQPDGLPSVMRQVQTKYYLQLAEGLYWQLAAEKDFCYGKPLLMAFDGECPEKCYELGERFGG